MRSVVAIFLLVLFSKGVLAGDVPVTTKLIQVGAASATYALVKLENGVPVEARPSCAHDGLYYSWDKTTDHGKSMLTVALSALMGNKNVIMWYSDSDCGYNGNRAIVTKILVLRD